MRKKLKKTDGEYVQFGFGKPQKRVLTHYEEIYKGKPVCIHEGGNQVFGIFLKEDSERGLIYLQPSISSNPDRTEVDLIEDVPTVIGANSSGFKIRPLKKGWIEDLVEKEKANALAIAKNNSKSS